MQETHTLLQGIFPTHRLNPGLLHLRAAIFFFLWGDSMGEELWVLI